MNKGAYILSFDSTTHAIQAEKALMQVFSITVIPTPREITKNCGLSIKINSPDIEDIMAQIKALNIPSILYCMGDELEILLQVA